MDFLMKRVVSTFPLEKPFSKRKLLNLSYQALGVCFNQYKTFESLKTWFEKSKFLKLGGYLTLTPSSIKSFKNTLLTSTW